MAYTYPPESKPLPGYTIKHGIGQGGFGEVYYAISEGGKEVALKLIQRQVEVELRGVRECLNLSHPSLVKIYDIVEQDGESWVVMEFCGGESLEEAIDRSPDGMPLDEAVAWLRGLCVGLAALHNEGIVHRDLKPSHIFLEDGVVKIADYGLAKFISVSRRSAHTEGIGTIHYTSPEMAAGKYGKEVDLYAVGVIFYEMLSGDVPFDGESPAEILMKHLTALPDMRGFPSPYREIIRKLLEKNPKRRYRSVEDLQAALSTPVICAMGRTRRFPKTPWAVAGFAGRGATRGVGKVSRKMFSNKVVSLLIVCMAMSFAALMVAVDTSESFNRMGFFSSMSSNDYRSINESELKKILVSTEVKEQPWVSLKEVAKFQRIRLNRNNWRTDRTNRLLNFDRYYDIEIDPTKAKRKGTDERQVLKAIWYKGYSPVLLIDIDKKKADSNGVTYEEVQNTIRSLIEGDKSRKKLCEFYLDKKSHSMMLRFARRKKGIGSEYPKLNPLEFAEMSFNTGGDFSKKIALTDFATIRIRATNPVEKR